MAKATKAYTAPAELVPATPDTEELALTTEAGQAIAAFMRQALDFFRTARQLETKATATLMAAKTIPMPQTGGEDEVVQTFIKRANGEKKVVEDHWAITSTVHALHKRLVARRKRSTDLLEEAAGIGQRLHNRYVEEAQRKAQQEQDRLRREAEKRARQDRERELADLERQAVAAEAASEHLSEREEAFVMAHARGMDATRAAERAGFKDAFKSAARLLASVKIQKALEGLRTAAAVREQAAAVQESPLDVQVETVKADVVRAAGAVDRTTKAAEILDAQAFVNAVIQGGFGIPNDALMPDPVKLNAYARSLGPLINKWPGIKLRTTTKTV